MINFQDVLKQKEREIGPLWSDEGAYNTAKEMQLLYLQKLSNIFLGISGFHLEKVAIGCLGTCLESSDIQNLLLKEKLYGPAVVNSVMSGGNNNRGKRGMSLIAETMEQLQVHSFLPSSDGGVFLDHHRNVIVDFMTYTWKVSIKMGNLKTQPFFISLWSTFNFLFKSCS